MKFIINRRSFRVRIDDIMLLLTFSLLNRVFHFEAGQTTRFRMYVGIIIMVYLVLRGSLRNIAYQGGILFYSFAIFIAGITNYGITSDLASTILMIIVIYDIIGMQCRFTRKYGFEELINKLFYISLFFVFLNDISIFLISGDTLSDSVRYFSGNKFAVSFIHMLFISLLECRMVLKNKTIFDNKIFFVIIAGYNIFICWLIECSTGIIGCIAIFIFLFFKNSLKMKFKNPVFFVLLLTILNYLFLGTSFLLNNAIVKRIISMMGEDTTLTGRTDIYLYLPEIISRKPFLGYGDNTTIVSDIVGYGNAQNGILHIAVQFGIIGVLAFIVMCYSALKKININNINYIFAICCFIYSALICSLVEICFSYNFIFAISIINVLRFVEDGSIKSS